MSNRLAVAAVTATLADRILDCATAEVSGARVLTSRPDSRRQPDAGAAVHLFLYQVVANPFLRNEHMPTRSADGALVDLPLAALDLNYLVSFTGQESSLEPQRLLGATVAELVRKPQLTTDEIADAVANRDYLAAADLAAQIERVHLSPVHLDLEELSRLWSILMHEPYALSLQYQASVVLVEPRVGTRVTKETATVGIDVSRRPAGTGPS